MRRKGEGRVRRNREGGEVKGGREGEMKGGRDGKVKGGRVCEAKGGREGKAKGEREGEVGGGRESEVKEGREGEAERGREGAGRSTVCPKASALVYVSCSRTPLRPTSSLLPGVRTWAAQRPRSAKSRHDRLAHEHRRPHSCQLCAIVPTLR